MTSLHSPRRNVTLARQVAQQIESMIISGQWQIGDRIPAEHDLVRRLGVSRNTVREALRSLVHARLLEARVGDGTYVRSTSAWESPFVERVRRADALDALEVRGILEQHGSRLAAERRTEADLARIRSHLADQEDAYARGDLDRFAQADSLFHREIITSAHNELLSEVYHHLDTALAESIRSALDDESIAAEQQDHHRALVEAISDGEPDDAARLAAALVETSRASLARGDDPRPRQPPTADRPD